MAFLGDEGKLTRFGDVARVADWVVSHKPKTVVAAATAPAGDAKPAAPALAPAGAVTSAPPQPPKILQPPYAAPMADPKPAPPIPVGVATAPAPAAPAASATP